MKQLHYTLQVLLHSKGSNLLKIISLSLALALSILLFARVAFEQSYDTCFKDYDRLYQVWSKFTVTGNTPNWQEMNCGPVAGAILENFPNEVESSTCTVRWLASSPLYYGNVRFDEPKVCADSLFFSTMGIEVLRGNPVSDLQQPQVVYLCETLAKKMFGGEDPVGKSVSYNHEYDLMVRGVYADLPDNTTVKADAVISMPPSWIKGRTNFSWNGGDSYPQYVRLKPGADAETINRRMEAMIKKYLPDNSFGYDARLSPLRDTYRGYDDVQRMKVIMLIMGFSILFLAAFNYALLSISSLSRRAKAVGVQKCSGASSAGIFGQFMLETGVVILCAILIMVLFLFGFRDFVEDTAATRLRNLFTWQRAWVPVLTVMLLFVIGGVLPGRLFARIPVTQVFRRYTEGKKGWKRSLLFVQFAGVAFFCGLMAMVTLQYDYVMNKDLGYNPQRIATTYVQFAEEERPHAYDFFRQLPYVEEVSASYSSPVYGYSGTFINTESGQNLFSARFDQFMNNYPSFMGMTLLQGRLPRNEEEVLVNETFAKDMHWGDDVLGRTVYTMGITPKVVGLLKDFQIEGFYQKPMPYIGFGEKDDYFSWTLYFKLREPFGDNLMKLNKEAAEAFPTKTIDISSMERQVEELYNPVRVMRNACIFASVVLLFIMLMGLLGYTADEVQRRSKEIAIRKVNGAEVSSILELLGRDVLCIALPAVVVGVLASAYVNHLWLSAFAAQVPVGWPLYVLTGIANVAIILACVLGRSWKIANENPVLSIKSE